MNTYDEAMKCPDLYVYDWGRYDPHPKKGKLNYEPNY